VVGFFVFKSYALEFISKHSFFVKNYVILDLW